MRFCPIFGSKLEPDGSTILQARVQRTIADGRATFQEPPVVRRQKAER